MNSDINTLQKALLEIYCGRENEPLAGRIAWDALGMTQADYDRWLQSRLPIEGDAQIVINAFPQKGPMHE